MLHTFDPFLSRLTYTVPVTPIYVMSDSDYQKRLDRANKAQVKALESRREKYENYIKSIDAELETLKT